MHYRKYVNILASLRGSYHYNIYRGCTHGCIYCDSRSVCYQINHPFEDVEVKTNGPAQLEDELKRKRKKGMITTGSMSDPYVHIEKELEYTRQILEHVYEYGFGISVLTKSDLVLRDLELLRKINQRTKAVVQITLTTYDEELCRIVEPNVATTQRRFEVLMKCKEMGIPTVVWLGPILPFINDTEENIMNLLRLCVKAKVKGILCFGMGLTLREGDREYYYAQLDRYFPGLKDKYIAIFGNNYNVPSPNGEYLMKLFNHVCKKFGIMHKTDEVFRYVSYFDDNL